MKFDLENVRCNLCEADSHTILYSKPDTYLWVNMFEFPVVQCTRCGLVYVNPRPTEESMVLYYSGSYHDGRDTAKHRKRYRAQLSFLPQLHKHRILDIGCARGDFLLTAKGAFPEIEVFGNDLFSDGVKSPVITFLQKALPKCDLPDDYFNIITSWAVFEHLHDPGAYFAEVHRILSQDGRFIFLVTNAKSFYSRWGYQEDIPRHLYHFSIETIRKYAERYGFVINGMRFTNEIFDGRGFGTFRYWVVRRLGLSWSDQRNGAVSALQKIAIAFGKFVDLVVFTPNWESMMQRSGIMVVEFAKRR